MRRPGLPGRDPSKSLRPGAVSFPRPSLPRKWGRETGEELKNHRSGDFDAEVDGFAGDCSYRASRFVRPITDFLQDTIWAVSLLAPACDRWNRPMSEAL